MHSILWNCTGSPSNNQGEIEYSKKLVWQRQSLRQRTDNVWEIGLVDKQ